MSFSSPSTTVALKHSASLAAQAAWTFGFAAATAIAARLEIPHSPVPYTLQTLLVLLSGAFLGWRNGAMSQLLYLAAGSLGLPVFAGGAAGLVSILGPTGGYLLAFPASAAVVGFLVSQERTLLWTFVSMAIGLGIVFVSGTLQLYTVMLHDIGQAINAGLLIFSWWDGLKLAAATMIYFEFAKRWPRLPGSSDIERN